MNEDQVRIVKLRCKDPDPLEEFWVEIFDVTINAKHGTTFEIYKMHTEKIGELYFDGVKEADVYRALRPSGRGPLNFGWKLMVVRSTNISISTMQGDIAWRLLRSKMENLGTELQQREGLRD